MKDNKQFVKGHQIKSTQSAGLASRGVPVIGPKDVTPHNNALEGNDIVQKGKVTFPSRYR